MQIVALLVATAVLGLGLIHVYWAHGGLWPGADEQTLVDKVVGEGTKFPSAAACYAVTVCLLLAGIFALQAGGVLPVLPIGFDYRPWVTGLIAFVFFARGFGGYIPAVERHGHPIFVRNNRVIYGPLCLVLGAAFAFLAISNSP